MLRYVGANEKFLGNILRNVRRSEAKALIGHFQSKTLESPLLCLIGHFDHNNKFKGRNQTLRDSHLNKNLSIAKCNSLNHVSRESVTSEPLSDWSLQEQARDAISSSYFNLFSLPTTILINPHHEIRTSSLSSSFPSLKKESRSRPSLPHL